jgi:hypothetical protein
MDKIKHSKRRRFGMKKGQARSFNFTRTEAFRVKQTTRERLRKRKRRIRERLARRQNRPRKTPALSAGNIHYEMADRTRGLGCGGIGAIHLLVRSAGLIDALDKNVQALMAHKPYHESDHILNIAYNVLAGGTCLEDLELLRNNEGYLDALGAIRIPDPTTAGDFCRRFESDEQVLKLMEAINQTRLGVWEKQDKAFFRQAILDADGTYALTDGECKKGMDINYKGGWGYHPLLISLANTREPLYLVNRSGNRPSHEQADEYFDKAIDLCERAGFEQMLLRGDTDFTQTWKLDEWDASGKVTFIFGADACKPFVNRAEALAPEAWARLERPARYEVKTEPRTRPENVKEEIVRRRGYKNFVLQWEDIAEFDYQPTLCDRKYRMIALRKKISVEKGQEKLFEQYRYFFYLTNDRMSTAQEMVFSANDRCDQENLIEQLKNGVHSMRSPLDNLHSNWAYMVMSSLAWTLKAWCGLLLPPQRGLPAAKHRQEKAAIVRMEFKRFVNGLMRLPCQIIRTGRRIIYRLLSWNPWAGCLIRLAEAMRKPMRC